MDKFLENIQSFLQRYIEPIAQKLNSNKILTTFQGAIMKTMPILIGSAFFSIISNFPITAVTDFLTSIGIKPLLDSFINTQTNLQPIFLAFLTAYIYAEKDNCNKLVSGIFALLAYFILMPSEITVGEEIISAYSIDYFGGTAIFSSLIIGILVAIVYCWTEKKNIVFKMPDSVPSFVANSFEPLFSGIIVIGVILVLSFLCQMTPYGNFFTLVVSIVQQPIVAIGASIPFMIILYTIVNIFWFFGIHPTAIMSLYSPVLSVILGSNVRAMMEGTTLPYLTEAIGYHVSTVGGTGCTLGLVIVMLLFSKSKNFKQITKLSFAPGIFNVNEPLMFGTPLIMNTYFLIPMLIVPGLSIGLSTLSVKLGIITSYNAMAAITTPWTMPAPITAFLTGGIPFLLVMCGIILISALIYYPFFKISDKQALEKEKEEQV